MSNGSGKSKGILGIISGILLIIATVLGINVSDLGTGNNTDQNTNQGTAIESTENDDVTDKSYVEYVFRNDDLLNNHYEKHGKEMGFSSAADYEKAASDVINNPEALTKTEAEDGDYVYYIEETNEFVILSTDGYIRTYFYPSGGKDYYDRQ